MGDSENVKKSNLEIIDKIIKDRADFNGLYISLGENDKAEVCVGISTHIFAKESAFWRAKMIESCVAMEMNLAQLLSAYFTEEGSTKYHVLNSMIFDRMGLNEKIKKVRLILSKYHSDINEKYKRNLGNIENLVKFRNELAHSLLSLTKDNIRNHSVHTDEILSKKGYINELEYFAISFYKDEELVSKTIKFKDIIKSIDSMLDENEVIVRIKNELTNLDSHK